MSVVLTGSAASQKLYDEWAPVGDAKCKEFIRKMQEFRCQWC